MAGRSDHSASDQRRGEHPPELHEVVDDEVDEERGKPNDKTVFSQPSRESNPIRDVRFAHRAAPTHEATTTLRTPSHARW